MPWSILDDPAIECGVIHHHPTLSHHFLQLSVADRVRDVPPHSPHDNGLLKLTALEVDHATAPPLHDETSSIAESPSREKLRQNRVASQVSFAEP